jgi:hypothetical protein
MKRYHYLFITLVLVVGATLISSFGGDDLKTSSGAPPAYTNSPADGQNCSHCMGGSAVAVNGWITSDIPADGYTPGTTYTITVTAPGVGKKGFEVSPQDPSGNLIGTLIAGTGNKLVGVNKYVTHSSAVITNPAVWNFQWKAPDPGEGDVTFYGSVAVTKTQTKTTTLTVPQSTVTVPIKGLTNLKLYPNPCAEKVNLAYNLANETPVKVALYSIDGKHLQTVSDGIQNAGRQTAQISINQPAGFYLLQITTDKGQKSIRVMKE